MSTKQLAVLVVCMSVLAAGLAWGLQKVEISNLQAGLFDEIRTYLDRQSAFKDWEAEHGE